MSKSKKRIVKSGKSVNMYFLAAIALLLAFAVYKFALPGGNEAASGKVIEGVIEGKDLKIAKADVTEIASFYSYKEADNYMEVIAVRASDGTIRTALNTCQVCYDSGRGYYKQVDDTLVCQNCGNVFSIDDVEVVRGGCNPVPIMEENKTEDEEFITISGKFLADNNDYFARWKR